MVETKYLPFLEEVLTQRRLDHSLGVMQVMGELAEVYDLDREKAMRYNPWELRTIQAFPHLTLTFRKG